MGTVNDQLANERYDCVGAKQDQERAVNHAVTDLSNHRSTHIGQKLDDDEAIS
jgi:hypothetical protein